MVPLCHKNISVTTYTCSEMVSTLAFQSSLLQKLRDFLNENFLNGSTGSVLISRLYARSLSMIKSLHVYVLQMDWFRIINEKIHS